MQTYWDYSEKERSEMTEQQVASLLDVELMDKGVLKPQAPTLTEIPKSPLGDKQKFYGVEGKGKYGSSTMLDVVFDSIEKAQKFIELCPFANDYDYEVGTEYRYTSPLTEMKIVPVELYDLTQINQFRSTLKHRKASAEQNEKLMSSFKDASRKADEITNHVWEDWHERRSRRESLKRIVDTFAQYRGLTNNDDQMALTFLEKVYRGELIQEAREWFSDSIPERITEMPAMETT